MIVISCVFKTILYIVNISSYKKDQFKLHRSFLGIKGERGDQSTQNFLGEHAPEPLSVADITISI